MVEDFCLLDIPIKILRLTKLLNLNRFFVCFLPIPSDISPTQTGTLAPDPYVPVSTQYLHLAISQALCMSCNLAHRLEPQPPKPSLLLGSRAQSMWSLCIRWLYQKSVGPSWHLLSLHKLAANPILWIFSPKYFFTLFFPNVLLVWATITFHLNSYNTPTHLCSTSFYSPTMTHSPEEPETTLRKQTKLITFCL